MKNPIWSTKRIAEEITSIVPTLELGEYIELKTRSGSRYKIRNCGDRGVLVLRKGEGDKTIAAHPFKGVTSDNRSLVFLEGWETTTLISWAVYRIHMQEVRKD